MINVDLASALIQKHLPDFGNTEIALENSALQTLSENLISDREYPPFDRVMMDGIAVNFNVFQEGKREFRVAGVCAAGEAAGTLSDFSGCLEVMTGAPLPEGADLVIPYEHLLLENGLATVVVETNRSYRENVHLHGSDIRKGEEMLKAGAVLNGPHAGISASIGKARLKVSRRPRVNIISTGDELVDITATPLAHQIRKSNSHALRMSLIQFGYNDVVLSHLPDEVEAIQRHFSEASRNFDVLIYSGGVSRGKFDFLPSCWKELGVREVFHGVSQRPGKPLWFGIHDDSKTAVFGLPGNPVSSLVCLHRYFLPQREVYAQLSEDVVFKKDLTYFLPVKLEFTRAGMLRAHPVKIQNSGEFSALAGTDGFLELPKDENVFPAGRTFRYFSWRPL